jgi:hypothetical protein
VSALRDEVWAALDDQLRSTAEVAELTGHPASQVTRCSATGDERESSSSGESTARRRRSGPGTCRHNRLRRSCIVVAVGVVAVIVTVAIGEHTAQGDHTAQGIGRLGNAALVALAAPMIALGVVRRRRKRSAVTVDAVLGGLCVYLLAGMFFGFRYGAVTNLVATRSSPAASTPPPHAASTSASPR